MSKFFSAIGRKRQDSQHEQTSSSSSAIPSYPFNPLPVQSQGPRQTVRTRICIISDTHCSFPPVPECDLLLHCGDLTYTGRLSELKQQYNVIASAPAGLKLVIAGNHDITLDRAYYARQGYIKHSRGFNQAKQTEDLDACEELWTSAEAKAQGVHYLSEGMSTHSLRNGARFTVYASPYQPEYCGWAFPYERHEDRFNDTPTDDIEGICVKGAKPVPDWPHVDLIMTHGPPLGILDKTLRGPLVGCENLLRADKRARPLLHCFGHIHEGWGAGRYVWTSNGEHGPGIGSYEEEVSGESDLDPNPDSDTEGQSLFQYMDLTSTGPKLLVWGEQTEFVNASIMNVRYKPVQKPWLIDIDLPMKQDG